MPSHQAPAVNLLEYLINDTASDGLLKGYLTSPFPEDQTSPTDLEVQAVTKQIANISNFKDLSRVEQNRYLDKLLAIERKVIFYTQSGKTLTPAKRLFVAFKMAHSTLNHDVSLMQNLKSVVAYGGSLKVRKEANEAGLLTMEEPMQLVRYLIVLEKLLSLSLKTAKKEIGLNRSFALAGDGLRKLRNQVVKITEEAKLENELSQKDIKNLHEKFIQVLGLNEQESGGEIPPQSEMSHGLITILEAIKKFSDQLEAMNLDKISLRSTSLHFSWTSFILDITKGTDVLFHEMAHYLHSQLDVGHFLTHSFDPEVRVQESQLSEQLEELYPRLQNAEFSFLGDYAKTNRAEFFAVASEQYLTNSSQLKDRDQDLFKMLAQVYGDRQLQFNKASTFWFMKNMFGPLSLLSHD